MHQTRQSGPFFYYNLGEIQITVYISGIEEAKAYLAHETLGTRLREATRAVLDINGKTIGEIMPGIDALKLKSSMTLFDSVSPNDIFAQVLDKFFDGQRDEKTLKMLSK